MVKQVGMRPPDFARRRFERDRLWTVRDQQPARRVERGRTAFFRAQACALY